MKRVTKGFALTAAVLALGGLGPAPAALAQQAGLEEIVVTATKRAESVQDVPVAVSVVDAATIEALQLDEFTDITRISPSLATARGDWATNSGFWLRGIGTNLFSINIEPSVSIIVDDVPLVRSSQAFTDLLDIERIEVLRGPQSTLFGKNANAGVINIVTKGVAEDGEFLFRATSTEDDQQAYSATISGPFSDFMGYRLTGFHKERDGHISNTYNGDKLDGGESHGGRLKLYFDGGGVEATLAGEYVKTESMCCNFPYREVPEGASVFASNGMDMMPNTADDFKGIPAAEVFQGIMPSETNDRVRRDGLTGDDSNAWGISMRLGFDVGEHQFLSISSQNRWEYDVRHDTDGTASFPSGDVLSGGDFYLESFSQELRLISPASDRAPYVVGIYYQDVNYGRHFFRHVISPSDWVADTGTESLAIYGQSTIGIGDDGGLIVGARLQNEEISHRFQNLHHTRPCRIADFREDPEENAYHHYCAGSEKEFAATFKVGYQHQVNDDIMAFASLSSGYKGQGYDIASGFDRMKSDNPVGSENAVSFEVGMKGTFWDDRVRVNPTLFYAIYDDYQAQQTLLVNNVFQFAVANVGELITSGLEVDFEARVLDDLRLVGGIAFVQADIEEFVNANCYPGQTAALGCVPLRDSAGNIVPRLDDNNMPMMDDDGNVVPLRNVQDLSGTDLNNSPDLKIALSAEYTLRLQQMPFDAIFNLSLQYQDELHFSLLGDPKTTQDAYALLNFTAGILERENRYSVEFFINNLLEEDFVSSIQNANGWTVLDADNKRVSVPAYTHTYPREAERYFGLNFGFSL